ncbi:hypothetical protein MTR67_026936 [Solanum verrucosum]|uniref:Uncharacterized protein n=1 Tax=Solanum verrucosum TaxID=315347 RepID=A0AAF0R879_SOLVR|nr:hypothetical protein MTR67_026936 [Solanum verrucosum]
MRTHQVFNLPCNPIMSGRRKFCRPYGSETLKAQYDELELDDFLTFLEELVDILAKDVWRLCSRSFIVDKFYWRHRQVEESTWEIELDI